MGMKLKNLNRYQAEQYEEKLLAMIEEINGFEKLEKYLNMSPDEISEERNRVKEYCMKELEEIAKLYNQD